MLSIQCLFSRLANTGSYTGAPYFSAMASARLGIVLLSVPKYSTLADPYFSGADLVHFAYLSVLAAS